MPKDYLHMTLFHHSFKTSYIFCKNKINEWCLILRFLLVGCGFVVPILSTEAAPLLLSFLGHTCFAALSWVCEWLPRNCLNTKTLLILAKYFELVKQFERVVQDLSDFQALLGNGEVSLESTKIGRVDVGQLHA